MTKLNENLLIILEENLTYDDMDIENIMTKALKDMIDRLFITIDNANLETEEQKSDLAYYLIVQTLENKEQFETYEQTYLTLALEISDKNIKAIKRIDFLNSISMAIDLIAKTYDDISDIEYFLETTNDFKEKFIN